MKKPIISIISALVGTLFGAGVMGKVSMDKTQKIQAKSDKHFALFLMANQWVKVKQEGKHLASYFEKNNYKIIAVYGMSYAGETLIDELQDSSVTIAYGIDKNADSIYADIDILSVDADLTPVDAVVVTAITFFDQIEEKLSEKLDCPIISLEDILYEV
jgi:hypothetical protein